ncbi:hypothetical protein ACE6H2_000280 [Prunus campanulata]
MANDIESSKDHTSIVVEDNLLEELKESMRGKLGPDRSPLPSTCCIFKVPQVLRRHNPKAYQPDVVSIGPFHRHRKQLQRMETVKQWYLRNLLSRMNISLEIFITRINKFLGKKEKGIVEFEKRAREFYAESFVHLTRSNLIEMMILDGCFVILLRKFIHREEKEDDPIFNMDCMFQYVCHDLLLLENQIPWFVLSCLYSVTLESYPGDPSQFSKVLLTAFGKLDSLSHNCNSYLEYLDRDDHKVDEDGVLHILDLLRTSVVFLYKPFVPPSRNLENDKKCRWWFAKKKQQKLGPEIPPATALSEAGIRFERGSANNASIMNIDFKDGVLTIPALAVGELTEPLLRNLIAFEQCYHGRSHQITSYAVLMDKLIASKSDMEFLCQEKIIGNWLSVEDGSEFFNKLYVGTLVKKFDYYHLCVEVNKYYDVTWNKNVEKLKRDYFGNPWKVTSLIAASFLLVLTLLQTIFTIHK